MPARETKLLQGKLDMLILKASRSGRCTATASGSASCRCPRMCCAWRRARSTRRSIGSSSRGGANGGVSENNLRAKFYKLTRAGRKQLEIEEENWERLAGAVFKIMQTTWRVWSSAFRRFEFSRLKAELQTRGECDRCSG
jgi:PadR family transcriptional regulator, regulatory protein PadR